jgi:hypothetical protein
MRTTPCRRRIDIDQIERDRTRCDGRASMLDILMVVIALTFFALTVGYAYACDRL